MANHKSAKKRARQTLKITARNKALTSQMRNAVKKVRQTIEKGDKDNAAPQLKMAQAKLAKLAQTGVIKMNTAARMTSRLASQVSKLS